MSLQSQDKARVSTLAALSILFSVAENALPRIIPFLKLGLANIPLIHALGLLDFKAFLLLGLLKWLLGNLMSGLLFSWLGLFSLCSTLSSVLAMKLVYMLLKNKLTAYGYSLIGALSSNAVQLFLASVYLSVSLRSLLPPVLLFSGVSAFITAALSYQIQIPDSFTVRQTPIEREEGKHYLFLLPLLALLSVPFNRSLVFLSLSFPTSLLLVRSLGRRIKPGYYAITFLCTLLLSSIGGEGRVLFLFFTEEALLSGVRKGLSLITLVALSKAVSPLLPISKGILAETIGISSEMLRVLGDEGSLRERLSRVLNFDFPTMQKAPSVLHTNAIPVLLYSLMILLFSLLGFCHHIMQIVRF
jgi:Predicted membrane protein